MENQTVSQGPASRVKALRELHGGQPALTKGGARYLHQVRSTLRRQFSIMRELPGSQFFTFTPPSQDLVESLMFAKEGLEELDWRRPEEGRYLGLASTRIWSTMQPSWSPPPC